MIIAGNVETYGRLYNWYAVNDSRNIAPEGWHVPTDAEWKQLEMFLGMSQSEADDTGWRGTDEGTKLKSTSGWNSDGNGTDDYGFTALPGGDRDYYGSFDLLGDSAGFWSATGYNAGGAWYRRLVYGYSGVYRYGSFSRQDGFSVRCVRD